MEITAKSYEYNTGVVTRKQFDEHVTLYKGYVNKTNEIALALAAHADTEAANATYSYYRGLKRGQTYALDGVILHELYFENLGDRAVPIGRKTQALFDMYFGGTDEWRTDFIACATAARGWCVLAYEQRTGVCTNFLFDSHHDGPVVSAYPLVVLDMYEHAYFLDYTTDKAAYIDRFVSRIPWDRIERRVAAIG